MYLPTAITLLLLLLFASASLKYPLLGLSILTFVWAAAFHRTGGSIGGLLLPFGDLCWLVYVICFGFHHIFIRRLVTPIRGVPNYMIMAVPYLLLALALPIAGWMLKGYPFRYSSPGFRQIEWCSFALFYFSFTINKGPRRIGIALLWTLVIASAVHIGYSFMQLSAHFGVIPKKFLYLDYMYTNLTGIDKFYYPRVTGYLTNPNAVAIFGALVFSLAVGLNSKSKQIPGVVWYFMVISAILLTLLSGSRSGLVGMLGCVGFLVAWGRILTIGSIGPFVKLTVGLAIPGITAVFLSRKYLADNLISRFTDIYDAFRYGLDNDASLYTRTEIWSSVWEQYKSDYSGSWAPPAYVYNHPIDSYYVNTIAQGSPVYTLSFVVFVIMICVLAREGMMFGSCAWSRGLSVVMVGYCGTLICASLGLSPIQQPHVIVIFWGMVGVVGAVVCRERMSSPRRSN